MEQAKQQQCCKFLKLSRKLMAHIASYLMLQDIQKIVQVLNETVDTKQIKEKLFLDLFSAQLVVKKYLNFIDRSVYLTFYGTNEFVKIEQTHCFGLSFFQFEESYLTYKINLKGLSDSIREIDLSEQVINQIENCIVNPQLPFAKMRKNGQGMFCNSSLQFFLVDKYFSLQQNFLEDCFEQLKGFMEIQLSNEMQKMKLMTPKQIEKIITIRTFLFAFQQHNSQELLIQGMIIHNSIVYVLGLIKSYIKTVKTYIDSFEDEISQFVQFCLRFSILRDSIVNLEEKISYLFKSYSLICQQVMPRTTISKLPQFSVWRSVLATWYQEMHQKHQKFGRAYFYLLTQYSYKILLKDLDETLKQFEMERIVVKNKLEMKEFSIKLKTSLYGEGDKQNYGVQHQLQKDVQAYQQILKQFTEYMVDISIDQVSVHNCGHSQHQLAYPFIKFQTILLELLKTYFSYLKQITHNQRNKQTSEAILKKVYENVITIFDTGILKPITLKLLIKQVNQILDKMQQQIGQTIKDENLQIFYDLGQEDSLLDYSNRKFNIKFNIEQKSQLQKGMFSISFDGRNQQEVKQMLIEQIQD